jgi:predicted transcriptional regulator
MSPRDGAARAIIDQKVRQVAAELGVSEAAALNHVDDRKVIELAVSTANTWHASKTADEVASGVVVRVPVPDAGQLVMGLAMAVGQMVREAYGELPASAGEPLDALGELGAALRVATEAERGLLAEVTLETLSTAQRTLQAAAAGVADGTVPVVIVDAARPQFARQLLADSELAQRLQP